MLSSCSGRMPTIDETNAAVSHLRDHDAWAWALGIGLIWADLILPVPQTAIIAALGIIYGDIGTSPLYVLKAIIGDRAITETLVYGGISCIFWTLVLQTTIKYIIITLTADNEGEGGIFSLYALVRSISRLDGME